jgi:hypothetical protein
MSKCCRETCKFTTNNDSTYCCSRCQKNGSHGLKCEGVLANLGASTPSINGPGFDLTRCVGTINGNGSTSITIAWNPVPGTTSYKVLKGGSSPIVLNSMFLNTFLDQTGCFESSRDLTLTNTINHKTLEVSEYLTTNTSYSFNIPASTTQN